MKSTRPTEHRRLVLAASVALAMASAAPAWAATCDEEPVEYPYVANESMYVFGPDLAAAAVAAATGVHSAPIGRADLGVADAEELDVTVDDLNNIRGDIPVSVAQHDADHSDWSYRVECLRAGERTTLVDLQPGHALRLTIIADTYGGSLCGGPGGTAGVLTVHP